MPTSDAQHEPDPDLMTDRPHSARTYDVLLGGKTNYAADRAAVEKFEASWPNARGAALDNRAFMRRAARYVTSLGIDQFLDIGTGIPTEPNLHQIVQAVVPTAHVVYVDNDRIVLAHAAALMAGDPRGAVEYVHADARDPAAILTSDRLLDVLDLTRPVGISVVSMLHFLDDDDTRHLIDSLVSAVPAGSTLTLSHGTLDHDTDGELAAACERYRALGIPNWTRSRTQLEELVAGLDVVEPGIVATHRWRPDDVPPAAAHDLGVHALVARKPDPSR